MTKYGYVVAHTFRVHRARKDPEPLGDFDGSGRDALVVLYGILRGLAVTTVQDANRHLRARNVEARGRTVRFAIELGTSGQTSEFFDPAAGDRPVFNREDRHIETGVRRGLIYASSRAPVGLLITEVRGRSGAKTLLAPTLSRIFRHYTEHVLDIATIADEDALRQFLERASFKEVTLRRTGLPRDIADAVQFATEDAEAGKLEMRIKPGSVARDYQRRIVERLRGDQDARRRLLQIHELDFSELSVSMEVGDRQTTLTVTADRVPTFVYDLPMRREPTDAEFYAEVRHAMPEIARAVGASVSTGWEAGEWSADARATLLAVPGEVSAGVPEDPSP
jgi:hypothetical protein